MPKVYLTAVLLFRQRVVPIDEALKRHPVFVPQTSRPSFVIFIRLDKIHASILGMERDEGTSTQDEPGLQALEHLLVALAKRILLNLDLNESARTVESGEAMATTVFQRLKDKVWPVVLLIPLQFNLLLDSASVPILDTLPIRTVVHQAQAAANALFQRCLLAVKFLPRVKS